MKKPDFIISNEIKLLIVEDSGFTRQMLKDLLFPYQNIKIDTASNGRLAMQKIKDFKPDVITLDINMETMDGIQLLKEMKSKKLNIPTIMISKEIKDSFHESLQLGAVDYISKPDSGFFTDIDTLRGQLVSKIFKARDTYKFEKNFMIDNNDLQVTKPFIIPKVIVIGSSTGGPKALYSIFSKLPKIKIPIIIVQHMPEGFTKSMSARLNKLSRMTVKLAEHGETLNPEFAYVVPGNFNLEIDSKGKINLAQDKDYKGMRPSINITLNSVNSFFKGRVLAVILTGIGDDGLDGVEELKELGGKCIAESEESCVVFGMPKSVIDAGHADEVSHLDKIPEKIIYYLNNWN